MKLPVYEIKELLKFHATIVHKLASAADMSQLQTKAIREALKDSAMRLFQLAEDLDNNKETNAPNRVH